MERDESRDTRFEIDLDPEVVRVLGRDRVRQLVERGATAEEIQEYFELFRRRHRAKT